MYRILSLKTKDTSASSWLFDFVPYFLAIYKNENENENNFRSVSYSLKKFATFFPDVTAF